MQFHVEHIVIVQGKKKEHARARKKKGAWKHPSERNDSGMTYQKNSIHVCVTVRDKECNCKLCNSSDRSDQIIVLVIEDKRHTSLTGEPYLVLGCVYILCMLKKVGHGMCIYWAWFFKKKLAWYAYNCARWKNLSWHVYILRMLKLFGEHASEMQVHREVLRFLK